MKIIANICGLLFFAGAFSFTIYILQKIVPVKYFSSVIWAYKNKRFVLPTVSVLLICISSILVLSSFGTHFLLLFGKAEGVVVLGQTQETLITFNPEKPDQGIKEYELMPTSLAGPHLYPGQTFKEAVNDRVMIKHPGHENYTVLFTHVFFYIFINLIVVMFLCCSFVAGFFLMMYHAVDLGIFEKPLNQDGTFNYFKERMGMSFLKALGIITVFFVASGIIASLISTRFHPIIEKSKVAAANANQAVLSNINPGSILKGVVVNKDTFSCSEYATRMDEGELNRRTISYNFNAYLVRFDDVYNYPVFVSRVYLDKSDNPEVLQQVHLFEEHLKNRRKADFLVDENYSVTIQIQ